MILISILVFVCVTTAIGGLAYFLVPTRMERQLQGLSPQGSATGWTTIAVKAVGPFARLSIPGGDWDKSDLRLRFMHAGLRRDDVRLIYFGAKTVLPVVFAFLAYVVMKSAFAVTGLPFLFWIVLSAAIGCFLPNAILSMRVRTRQRELFESFPDAADLMLVCVEAGLGMDAAMTRVAEEIQPKCASLAEELQLTNLEIRAGASRETALRNLAQRSGLEELGTFATMLTQSDKFGTSIGDALRVFSEELRHKRQIRAEELAAKVPTKMLFPLVAFIFPSIIMVILGPAIIQIIHTAGPVLGSK